MFPSSKEPQKFEMQTNLDGNLNIRTDVYFSIIVSYSQIFTVNFTEMSVNYIFCFAGGKKCPKCGCLVFHENWKLTPELSEARWAHQEARRRELAEVVDFLQ